MKIEAVTLRWSFPSLRLTLAREDVCESRIRLNFFIDYPLSPPDDVTWEKLKDIADAYVIGMFHFERRKLEP